MLTVVPIGPEAGLNPDRPAVLLVPALAVFVVTAVITQITNNTSISVINACFKLIWRFVT
jgi:hypothetical protein